MLAPEVRSVPLLPFSMRDQHKSKLGLVDEVVGLRKQVEDLKASANTRRRVEDALRQADEFHRRLLDALPVAVGCLDSGGHLLLANQALAELLGYGSRSELMELGDMLGVFADPFETKRVLTLLAETRRVRRMGARCRSKDGQGLDVTINAGNLPTSEDAAMRFALHFERGEEGT